MNFNYDYNDYKASFSGRDWFLDECFRGGIFQVRGRFRGINEEKLGDFQQKCVRKKSIEIIINCRRFTTSFKCKEVLKQNQDFAFIHWLSLVVDDSFIRISPGLSKIRGSFNKSLKIEEMALVAMKMICY